MANERLRSAMLRHGFDPAGLARQAAVSEKSVTRWLSGSSLPYPRTRYRIASVLGQDESYLWPEAVDRAGLAAAELLATYPQRTDVPRHLWTDLPQRAERNIDVLAYAGLFLTEEHSAWLPTLQAKLADGVRVRLLLGDPEGTQVAARDGEQQIGGGVGGRVAAVLSYYQALHGLAEIRLHDTPLYNSIYRFDDELLVNVHVYGVLAAHTPTTHIRRIDGAFYNTYLEGFERVWASARQLPAPEEGRTP